MGLKAITAKKLAETKQSQAIQKELMVYQDYFEKAKGHKPQTIRVTPEQLKKLGVDSGYYFNGSYLEVAR